MSTIHKKWKEFAVGQILGSYNVSMEPSQVFDALVNAEIENLDDLWESLDIAIWEPFEDFSILRIVDLLEDLAFSAQQVCEG